MTARETLELCTTTDGGSQADPDALLACAWRCVDGTLARAGALGAHIEAVAATTFVGNVLGVDERDRAVTPLITYADTCSVEQVDWLRRELDEDAVHQRTGCPFHTSYLPAQLLWLAQTQPDLFQRVARWISLGEYGERQLFPLKRPGSPGQVAVSYSVASWTGLLNRRGLEWDAPLLAVLPVGSDQLSPLGHGDEPHRGLRDRFADRWPALRDVPWFPAVADGAAANVGSGCMSPDRVALTVGTTSAVRLVTEDEVGRVPDGLWCYRVDGHRSLPGGALSEGGNLFAWMRATLQLPHRSQLDAALEAMAPDSHGLTVLPFLTGERSPGWAGDARATLHGLSLATTPLDILRAGMEAVAYRVALILDRLRPLLRDRFQVVASGGALINSSAWLQIMADVLGRPVAISQVEEASARGTALLALQAMGALDDLGRAPSFVGASVQPDAGRRACYVQAVARQQMLYDKLVGDAP
jgi:gluconokinase